MPRLEQEGPAGPACRVAWARSRRAAGVGRGVDLARGSAVLRSPWLSQAGARSVEALADLLLVCPCLLAAVERPSASRAASGLCGTREGEAALATTRTAEDDQGHS